MPTRLLVVDDSPLARASLRDLFAATGRYAVVGEAQDGKDAVRLYRELRPDLVTMDIVMPEMDGIEAVRQIVALDPRARVLMVSAHGQEGLVLESLVAGAADFVLKPLDPQRTVAAADRVVAGGLASER